LERHNDKDKDNDNTTKTTKTFCGPNMMLSFMLQDAHASAQGQNQASMTCREK
jgi:hypothetical protein